MSSTQEHTASLTDVTNDQHGVAGAFNITAQQIGASFGTAALVAIVASVTHTDDPIDRLGGYHLAYLTIACLLVVGTVVTAVLFGRPSHRLSSRRGHAQAA